MSADFVKANKNKDSIVLAARQEAQLSYLTQSKVQDTNLSVEYLNQWAQRNYESNDAFLNFVKSVFSTDNFLSFYRYFRTPVASSKIVNNKIKPNLKRVFQSEDKFEKYVVSGVDQDRYYSELNIEDFNKKIFDAILFKHNSVLVTDLYDVNKPTRTILDVEDITSIDYDFDRDRIERIAFRAEVDVDEVGVRGFLYIDEKAYIFYSEDYKELRNIPHDLGRCPAHFITYDKLNKDPIVKASIFSYIREEMEEYVFLKTLQRMTEPNGAIPITIKLDATVSNDPAPPASMFSIETETTGSEPMASGVKVSGRKSPIQAGTIIEVPQVMKPDGGIDMSAVQDFLKFIYIPVEALEYLNNRLKEIHDSIVSTILGDVVSSNEKAKNETQVEKGVSVLEDNLRYLSGVLSRIRTLADYDFLALKYGAGRVQEVSIYYGSDFFFEDESTLYSMFAQAPNQIERMNILLRLSQNRFKNNKPLMNRQEILYHLMPFSSDKDFQVAMDTLDPDTFAYQVRFSYWIAQFEAEYGDLLAFYNAMPEASKAQKYLFINNLIKKLIKDENDSIASVQRERTPVQQNG